MAFGVRVYRLRIKPAHQRQKDKTPFMRNGDLDAWALLGQYFDARKKKLIKLSSLEVSKAKQQRERRALWIREVHRDEKTRSYWGICEVGEYGSANPIRNVDSGGVAYPKKVRDSDMPPYYFRVEVPDGMTSGLLLCGTRGVHSPKGPLERDMKRVFARNDLTLKITALMDAEAIKEYIAGGAIPKELEVIGRKQTRDSRKIMKTKVNGAALEVGSVLRVSVRESDRLKSMLKAISGALGSSTKVRKLLEVPGFEDFDVARVLIRNADGKSRWFNIVKPGESGLSYDVTEEIRYGDDGYPTLRSMDKRAKAIRDEIESIAFLPA